MSAPVSTAVHTIAYHNMCLNLNSAHIRGLVSLDSLNALFNLCLAIGAEEMWKAESVVSLIGM
jgi:hypothetical protein